MDSFCIIANRSKDRNLTITGQIEKYLQSRNRQCFIAPEKTGDGYRYTDGSMIPAGTECAIVLGGDGTMIHAAHDLAGRNIPVLGINLGTFGFLAETETKEIERTLDCLMDNEYRLEKRMMLSSRITTNAGVLQSMALNDVVITRSGYSRLISTRVHVNGALVSEYYGDGVIISTPTGSTGYSLSAGGPVVTPEAELILITPICPHTLNDRCIIVAADDTVRIEVMESRKTRDEEAIATIDGAENTVLNVGDYVEVKKAVFSASLIRLKDGSFFELLHDKLEGKH